MNFRDLFTMAEAERHFDRLRRDFDRAFDGVQSGAARFAAERAVAPADLFETASEAIILIDLPGMAEEDIDLRFADSALELRAARKADQPEGASQRLKERAEGELTRTLSLPPGLDGDAATASLKNGVLTVRIPRETPAQGRRITVSAE